MPERILDRTEQSVTKPRFDPDALKEIAGDAVFERGRAYQRDQKVELLEVGKTRVRARVLGSEVYRTVLAGRESDFSGDCTCRAFSDHGFCKHLVATALAANAFDPAAAEAVGSRFARIREYLRAKDKDTLIAMIMELAERDFTLFEDLELAATASTADDETIFVRFKKSITDATRTHGYVEYRDARQWADSVAAVLERVRTLIDDHARVVLRLMGHFFERMDHALQNMDDSDGQGGAVYAKGCGVHLEACLNARPDPVALAQELFAREIDSDWEFFHGASETYADALGESGLAEYRRLAEKAWQKIQPRWQGKRGADEEFGARYRLGSILESFAERDGDLDARIAIRAKDLSSAYSYLGIAQLCLDHDRKSEALKWTEDGLWEFEDRPDERLVLFAAELYRTLNRREDADALLWHGFERSPSEELYRALKAGARSDKLAAEATRDRALALLRARLDAPKKERSPTWSRARELLLDVMLEEKQLDEAWQVVRDYGSSKELLEALAKASEKSHPGEALTAYAQQVERLVSSGGNNSYEAARRLIGRMEAIRKKTNGIAAHAAYISDLKVRHKFRRNFVRLL
jgi:uncharacterized Zn finger protein